jgi:arginase
VKNVKIISIESDFGAGKKGAKFGPQALLKELPQSIFSEIPVDIINIEDIVEEEETNFALHIEAILEVVNQASTKIQEAFVANQFPWIISGDHSNGLAAITAYKEVFPQNKLGVIWIDAHADVHTPYTSPSGNMHGMPLAAAMGILDESKGKNQVDKFTQQKWKALTKLGSKKISPKLEPSNLVFIDIRDLESEETNLLLDLNIKHFVPNDRRSLGLDNILKESIAYLSHCDHIIVSFDVDSIDPSNSSGTGTPVHDGLSKQQAIETLSYLLAQPNLFAFEITEINPLLDRLQPMEKLAAEIIKESFEKSGLLA